MSTYDLTSSTFDIDNVQSGDVINVPYSGKAQSVTLPQGTYTFKCWGAQGGYRSSDTYGGKGGYSVGTLTLASPTKIFAYVGGAGNTGKTNGGFNGGGKRATYNGGGGASDIRIGVDSLYSRVIVAGGGGSDGNASRGGGAGGGITAQDTTASNYGTGGYGATQTGSSGGSGYITSTQSASSTAGGFGFGGSGLNQNSGYGGAGGGGWYGGAGTTPDGSGDDDKGGGGGSGYVYTSSTASNYPSGCKLTSVYYLSNASTTVGTSSFAGPTGTNETGHSGNGYISIVCTTVINKRSVTVTTGANGNLAFKTSEDYYFIESERVFKIENGESASVKLMPDYRYNPVLTINGTAVAISNNSYTISSVTADMTVAASFIFAGYDVKSSAGTGGTISPAGTTVVESGGSLTFTITPDEGYSIKDILVNNIRVGSTSPYTLSNVTSDTTVNVIFKRTCKVTTTVIDGDDVGYISGEATVTEGDTYEYTLASKDGVSYKATVKTDKVESDISINVSFGKPAYSGSKVVTSMGRFKRAYVGDILAAYYPHANTWNDISSITWSKAKQYTWNEIRKELID